MDNTTPLKTDRIVVVDALRGFAVVAIMLLHFCEHFIYGVYPEATSETAATLNSTLFDSLLFLFGGKSYAIFALLFGFTFVIQQRNQELRGSDFGGRFAWRLLILMGFASLNALFFPGGDVLMLFAVMGFVMIPLRKLSERALLLVAALFLVQPIELLECFGVQFMPTLLNDSYYPSLSETVTTGSFWAMAKANLTTGQLASLFWAADVGRLLQAPGLFIIGMVLARGDYFRRGVEFWAKPLVVGIIASFVLYIAKQTADGALETLLTMWYNLAFTAVLLSTFVLLFASAWFERAIYGLQFYGRMSLTNYVSQSIIGSLIFFPYALGLADDLGMVASFGVGLGVMCVQILFCRWWLRTHKQGPLEGLWHRLTWLK